MDRYEFRVSMDEIDRLIEERRFKEAAVIADKIDWTKVRGTYTLCRISDLYKINRRYQDSRDLLEIAYERKPDSRKIIYSLCELELKLDNYIHALQLYNAFINIAPRDSDRFLLQYKLYKKQDVNVYEQIAVLEEFLQRDFRERWAYELAVLYQKAGDEQSCIRQCDEIVAYFGDGRFVVRALELKKSLTMLTPQQEERLELLLSGGAVTPPAPKEDSPEDSPREEAADAGTRDTEPVSDEDISKEAAQGTEPDTGVYGKEDLSGIIDSGANMTVGRDSLSEKESDDRAVPAARKEDTAAEKEDSDRSDSGEGNELSASPEEYTDVLLRDEKMQETIARGMREIDDDENAAQKENDSAGDNAFSEDASFKETETGESSEDSIENGSGDIPEEEETDSRLNLEQIMSEWEKIRRESEQQRLAEARRRVLERSDEVKRQLYGDTYSGYPDSSDAGDSEPAEEAEGDTRSWKREDVEQGIRQS